ncbi:MAG: DUF488 family protein [Pyrobaculum sp.]
MYWQYMAVYTIGYSGFSPEEFLHTLAKFGVEAVVDVRRYPRSKTAFYTASALREELGRVGVEYLWFGELGALGVRGPRAGCVDSATFDMYVWRLYHYAPAILQLDELARLAERRVVALVCREEDWRRCHRQFIADYLARRGFPVLHIRKRGTEGHVKTKCAEVFDPPPVDVVRRVYEDFRHLCSAGPVYLFGGALEGSAADVDVVVYGLGEELPRGYDAQFIPAPREDLFHFHVTYNGVLICGKPIKIPFERSLANELGETEERVRAFLHSGDPVVVCKAAKELAFAAAAVLCGPRTSTWKRVKQCLEGRGLELPQAFKNCLAPPPPEVLKLHRSFVEKIAEVLRGFRASEPRGR